MDLIVTNLLVPISDDNDDPTALLEFSLLPCNSAGTVAYGRSRRSEAAHRLNDINQLRGGDSIVVDRNMQTGCEIVVQAANEELMLADGSHVRRKIELAEELARRPQDEAGSYCCLQDACHAGRARWTVLGTDIFVRPPSSWYAPSPLSRDMVFRPQHRSPQSQSWRPESSRRESRAQSQSAYSESAYSPAYSPLREGRVPESSHFQSQSAQPQSAQPQSSHREGPLPDRRVSESLRFQSQSQSRSQSSRQSLSSEILTSHVAALAPGSAAAEPASVAGTGDGWRALPMADCTLGFSVQESMQRAPPACADDMADRARELIKAWHERRAGAARDDLALAMSRVTVHDATDTCVICLTGPPEAGPIDCVLLPCGHACCHYDEAERLRACPLCRAPLSARVARGRDGAFLSVEALRAQPPRQPPERSAAAFGAYLTRADVRSEKPVIYLYSPAREVEASVEVALRARGARFTVLLPRTGDFGGEGALGGALARWRVRVMPDGSLLPRGEAPSAPAVASLFWEGAGALSAGACASGGPWQRLRGTDAGDWLLRCLPRLGLSVREATEMAQYWGPRMAAHACVEARFLSQDALDAEAPLTILPAPDATLRVYLLFRAGGAVGGEPPALPSPPPMAPAAAAFAAKRMQAGSFVAVEWGGAELQG